jgi:CcmD family protein
MSGAGYLIAAFSVVWVGLIAYLGWIALRIRGVRLELETTRALVEEREVGNKQT